MLRNAAQRRRYVQNRETAFFYHGDCFLQSLSQRFRRIQGSRGPGAEAAGDGREIDDRIPHGLADPGIFLRAISVVGDLDLMHFVVPPCRIVVDDMEHRYLIVRGRPETARCHQKIAIAAEGDTKLPLVAKGERRADGSRRIVAYAPSAVGTQLRPRAREIPYDFVETAVIGGGQHPGLVLYRLVNLVDHALNFDR